MEKMKKLLQQYMESWIRQDKQMFLDTLASVVDIRECYGASYSTKEEAEVWFTEWNKLGKVLDWEMKEVYFDSAKQLLFATWKFHYFYPNAPTDYFDGITVMSMENERITLLLLYEYETKHERFYPYRKEGLEGENH